jgi:hypothetical protein
MEEAVAGQSLLRKDPARIVAQIALAVVGSAVLGLLIALVGSFFYEALGDRFYAVWGLSGVLLASIYLAGPFADRLHRAFSLSPGFQHGWPWLAGAAVIAIAIYGIAKLAPVAPWVAEGVPFLFLGLLSILWFVESRQHRKQKQAA